MVSLSKDERMPENHVTLERPWADKHRIDEPGGLR